MSNLLITQGLGTAALTVVSVTPAAGEVVVEFSSDVYLVGDAAVAANWLISSPGNPEVTVTGMIVSGSTVTLTTTEQKNGATYTLTIPYYPVSGAGSIMADGYTQSFVGVAVTLVVVGVRGVDARTVDVVFSKAVVESEALEPENYAITAGGTVSIVSVEKVTSVTYRLTTTEQVPANIYTLQVSGVHDLAGNLI